MLLLKEAAYFMTAKNSRVYFDARVKYRAKRSSVVAQLGQSNGAVAFLCLSLLSQKKPFFFSNQGFGFSFHDNT